VGPKDKKGSMTQRQATQSIGGERIPEKSKSMTRGIPGKKRVAENGVRRGGGEFKLDIQKSVLGLKRHTGVSER